MCHVRGSRKEGLTGLVVVVDLDQSWFPVLHWDLLDQGQSVVDRDFLRQLLETRLGSSHDLSWRSTVTADLPDLSDVDQNSVLFLFNTTHQEGLTELHGVKIRTSG